MKSFLPSMFYYGLPVVLLTTIDRDGNADVTPISCNLTLGTNTVIALVELNKTYHSVMEVPGVVFNLPPAEMREKVGVIAPYTAQNPVPPQKVSKYTYTDDEFTIGGSTQLPSEKVRAPRIAKCPIQAEAVVKQVDDRGTYAPIELEFVQVHTEDRLVVGGNEINLLAWEPLIYNFKHYYGLGEYKGLNFTIKWP